MLLEVSGKRTRFDVHKRQLCEASPFFEAAFNGSFRENSGAMELLEDDDTTFEQLIQWVYQRKLEISWPDDRQEVKKIHKDLLNLYILADKYNINSLMDQIMDVLFNAVKRSVQGSTRCLRNPPLAVVQSVYNNSAQGSQLRRFMIACFAWFVDLACFEQEGFSITLSKTPELASDLAVVLALRLKDGKQKDPFWGNVSLFLTSSNTITESQTNTQSSSYG